MVLCEKKGNEIRFSQKLREENTLLKGRAGEADVEAAALGQAWDACLVCTIFCLSTMMFTPCFPTPPSYATTFFLFVTAILHTQRVSEPSPRPYRAIAFLGATCPERYSHEVHGLIDFLRANCYSLFQCWRRERRRHDE